MRKARMFWILAHGLVASTAWPQATPYSEAITADVIALRNSADLVANGVGLSPAGEVTFLLHNRGAVGINIAGKGSARSASLRSAAASVEGPPIKIDIFIGGVQVTSVYQASLAGQASAAFAVKPTTNVPRCMESRDITIVVDQPRVIQELHDDNNATATTAVRPCPDLVVVKIERHKQGVAGEQYQAKVTIANRGTAASPITEAWATALTSAPGLNGWPEFGPNEHIPALTPGQTYSFRVGGSVFSVASSWVSVFLVRHLRIEEPDESNNRMNKKI